MADGAAYNSPTLASFLSIYPIRAAVATHLLAGDLIRLSRLSTTLRSVLRSFPKDIIDTPSDGRVQPGHQSTPSWQHLLSLTTYDCSAQAHKPLKSGPAAQKPQPCRHCSLPICETCIIRVSLAKSSSEPQTPFRSRTRFLCPTCWAQGRLRRDSRYPADGTVNRERIWEGRGYGLRGGWCGCSAKKDQWVCGECREYQGRTFATNEVPTIFGVERITRERKPVESSNTPAKVIWCYGDGCTNAITESDRDRRRICLWCSRGLARPYGGEERLKWDAKFFEARTVSATSRSLDIEEWARIRNRTLTMSRRQMRGVSECLAFDRDAQDHNLPQFVRHFDAVNYRAVIRDETYGAVPDPESVWRSKNGRWIYHRRFMKLIGQSTVMHCVAKGDQPWGRVRPAELREATGAGSTSLETDSEAGQLAKRRTNAELRRQMRSAKLVHRLVAENPDLEDLVQRRVRLLELMTADPGAYYEEIIQDEDTEEQVHPALPMEICDSIVSGAFLDRAEQLEKQRKVLEGLARSPQSIMGKFWKQGRATKGEQPDDAPWEHDEARVALPQNSERHSPDLPTRSSPELPVHSPELQDNPEPQEDHSGQAEEEDIGQGTVDEVMDMERGDPPPYMP